MPELIRLITVSILTTFYQSFWFSVLIAVLFAYIWRQSSDLLTAGKQWLRWFRTEKQFRRIFLLTLYSAMILSRTLLNRNLWTNPLSDVLGGWGLFKADGSLTTEAPENLILFIPFAYLYLSVFRQKNLPKWSFAGAVRTGTRVCFCASFLIEFLQLFLRLGTWQFADLFYNTLGGTIGGFAYWLIHRKSDSSMEFPRRDEAG